MTLITNKKCYVCGGLEFSNGHTVLWQELIDELQLSHSEVSYINAQQGNSCLSCGSNIRSIVLAKSIVSFLNTDLLLKDIIKSQLSSNISLLEINEAGNLTKYLREFENYRFGSHPEINMHSLPFEADSFDLIVHSDTLEHIENPKHALSECYRVLKHKGALCFTVPIIKGRMSRNRAGLSPSYHGDPQRHCKDFMVHTEFGADIWALVIESGFSCVEIHTFMYPSGIALLATKD